MALVLDGAIKGRGGVFVVQKEGEIWIWRLFGRIDGESVDSSITTVAEK